ncbi:hypothetical protein [Marivita sp.]|uniref:hypothetical protein n=1 Tax=Marivita sp. TaxID=2003365 RepID=UPI00261136A2|nr:hypothetical protein [Marivita sp.]
MCEGYATFDLVWEQRTIAVSYQSNWLGLGHWHIELRCKEALPVTETGYRSRFVPCDALASEVDIEGFVMAWLDHAATCKEWQEYLVESRQFKLF